MSHILTGEQILSKHKSIFHQWMPIFYTFSFFVLHKKVSYYFAGKSYQIYSMCSTVTWWYQIEEHCLFLLCFHIADVFADSVQLDRLNSRPCIPKFTIFINFFCTNISVKFAFHENIWHGWAERGDTYIYFSHSHSMRPRSFPGAVILALVFFVFHGNEAKTQRWRFAKEGTRHLESQD